MKDKVDEFMKKVIPDKNPTAEKAEAENPTQARNAKSSQSGHSSVEIEKREPQNPERSLGEAGRPSVRKQLEEIRKDMDSGKTSDRKKEIQKSNRHKAPKKKRRRYGKEAK